MNSKFKLADLRLAALLSLLSLVVVVLVAVRLYTARSTFDSVTMAFAESDSSFPSGEIVFGKDGTARFRFVGEAEFEAPFDREQFERVLWRYQNLAVPSTSQGLPRSGVDVQISTGTTNWDTHIDFSRKRISRQEMLALYLGAEWAASEVTREDLNFRLLHDLIVSIDEQERVAFSHLVQKDRFTGWESEDSRSKAVSFLTWLESPDVGGQVSFLASPLPWKELSRTTAPTGLLDAVLVSKMDIPFGDPEPGGDAEPQTYLYLVPRGAAVQNEPTYPTDGTPAYFEWLQTQAPMMLSGSDQVSLVWEAGNKIRVSAASITQTWHLADSFETTSGKVFLKYEIQRRDRIRR